MSAKEFVLQFQAGTRKGQVDLGAGLELSIDSVYCLYHQGVKQAETIAPIQGQQVSVFSDEDKLQVFFGRVLMLEYHWRQASKNSPSET